MKTRQKFQQYVDFEFYKKLYISFTKGGKQFCIQTPSMIFLPAILIPACASSSLAFLMIYFAYKLNKQGDNVQPWCTPFLILNQSIQK